MFYKAVHKIWTFGNHNAFWITENRVVKSQVLLVWLPSIHQPSQSPWHLITHGPLQELDVFSTEKLTRRTWPNLLMHGSHSLNISSPFFPEIAHINTIHKTRNVSYESFILIPFPMSVSLSFFSISCHAHFKPSIEGGERNGQLTYVREN